MSKPETESVSEAAVAGSLRSGLGEDNLIYSQQEESPEGQEKRAGDISREEQRAGKLSLGHVGEAEGGDGGICSILGSGGEFASASLRRRALRGQGRGLEGGGTVGKEEAMYNRGVALGESIRGAAARCIGDGCRERERPGRCWRGSWWVVGELESEGAGI